MSNTNWPKNVMDRYLTVAGQALTDPSITVDVTLRSDDDGWDINGSCRACNADFADSHYISRSRDTARHWAQEHAEKCRALPKPDGA